MRRLAAGALFSLSLAATACARKPATDTASTTPRGFTAPEAGARTVQRAPSPTRPAETLVLDVPGFEPAIVSFPESRRREPLLVAVHGAGDGPRWQCATFREIVGNQGALLCPAGRSFGRGTDANFHPNHFELEKLVEATLEAFLAAFPDRVDDGPAIYAAYSQGATMGALMLPAHASRFPNLILVEGGYSEWNVARGLEFRKAGGRRILFGCGTKTCARKAERSAEWLERAGVSARVRYAPGAGHTYGGRVAEGVRTDFAWVTEGDARWVPPGFPGARSP